MPRFEFAPPSPASVYVEIGRGEVRVRCAETPGTETTTVTVEGRDADRVDVHDRDGQISVLAPRGGLLSAFDSPLEVTITAPEHSNVATKLGSAEVVVDGPAGGVRLRTGSGEVEVVPTSSAKLTVIRCGSGSFSRVAPCTRSTAISAACSAIATISARASRPLCDFASIEPRG